MLSIDAKHFGTSWVHKTAHAKTPHYHKQQYDGESKDCLHQPSSKANAICFRHFSHKTCTRYKA
uniref:Uncharacterized protein n=1 Tax=Arundo donax TaxID=35708 RepID=A0A0A9H4I6_ARUDO